MSNMLSSWKEIAQFFGKGVRTVQRWEKTMDLPIHRPPGAPSNVVLARESDLEAWMHRGVYNSASEHDQQNQDLQGAFETIHHAIQVAAHSEDSKEKLRAISDKLDGLQSEVKHAHEGGNSIAA